LLLATGLDGPGRPFLTLWAHARNGRAIPRALFDALSRATPRHHPLLAGLVVATTIEKPRGTADHGLSHAAEQFFQLIG
jgi:hypothetical protein